MNSKTLLVLMDAGATVVERWKPLSSWNQKAKQEVFIKHVDGHIEHIQRSCLEGLTKARLVDAVYWVGGNVEYRIKSSSPVPFDNPLRPMIAESDKG